MNLYDQIHYEDEPFPNTHPQAMSAIGKLYGINAKAPNSCRFLELGAARGNNIIGMGYALPKSEFVGVDLSSRQVNEGNELINSLGLSNVKLIEADILNIGSELGKFDYIIAHGLLSWVSDDVREGMFNLCSRLLNENGICYFSYNTYPGWKARDVFRDMMLFEGRESKTKHDLVEYARKSVNLIHELLQENSSDYSKHLREELKHYIHRPDWYYLHDFLSEDNKPLYISEVMSLANKHQLQYFSDTELSMNTTLGLGNRSAKIINSMKDDLLSYEQYLDISRLRSFRRSLFCKKDVKVERDSYKKNIESLFISGNLSESIVEDSKLPVIQFSHANGGGLRISDICSQTAIRDINNSWPRAISFSSIRENLEKNFSNDEIDKAINGIITSVFANIHEVKFFEGSSINVLTNNPIASNLARFQASKKETVTSLIHNSVYLEKIERELLISLDGTRSIKEISDQFILNNLEIDNLWINKTLYRFLKEGLLEG